MSDEQVQTASLSHEGLCDCDWCQQNRPEELLEQAAADELALEMGARIVRAAPAVLEALAGFAQAARGFSRAAAALQAQLQLPQGGR